MSHSSTLRKLATRRRLEHHLSICTFLPVLLRCAFFLICVRAAVLLLAVPPISLAANDVTSSTEALQKALSDTRKIAPAGFTALIQPPFIVVGDESPAKVRQRAESTVKWAVDRLKQDFFVDDPDEVITIWLFKAKANGVWLWGLG